MFDQGSIKKQFSAPIKTGDKYQIRLAGVADRDIPLLQAALVDKAASTRTITIKFTTVTIKKL
ncbi:MAG: hypothetical protein LBG43_04870 [Treponema sp.]|jgi:hypothetical protein|nr:hypothetical protein [Treponema sp.]